MRTPQDLELATIHGPASARLYAAVTPVAGVVTVGGIGGGFDSPASNLYARLGEALLADSISLLRVRFRDPTDLDEAVIDLLAGVDFLVSSGIERVGLVGHSFGGAVAITAAGVRFEVRTVVTIATQAYGARVDNLGNRSLLLIHGTNDEILPERSSVSLQHRAKHRAVLELIEGGDHVLDAFGDVVFDKTRNWLRDELTKNR